MPIQLENETGVTIAATDVVIVRRGAGPDDYTIEAVLIGEILDRDNHTGTQLSTTISDFDAAVDARIALSPGGATDLSWTASTRTIASSTGADAVITLADGTNAGLMASADFTKLAGISGTNTGDQTITLTGDVTGSGTGSFAATIGAGAVTYAKMQATALGNVVLGKSGAAGTVTEIQLGLNNLLGRGSSGNLTTITVDSTLTFTGSALGVTSGTYVTVAGFDAAVAATPAVTANTAKVTNATHTGDVTGATALTLATVNSNVGAFGSATQIPTFTVNAKGLTTAAANVAISIPSTQVNDFNSAARAQTEAELIAGSNITITPAGSGATRTLTIASTGGGGGGFDYALAEAMRGNLMF